MSLNTLVGRTYSDSYVTLSEADVIVETLPDSVDEWQGLSTLEKEYRLKLAAQLIGMLSLRGRKAYQLQTLAFPRTVQADVEEIPEEVKNLQVALAYQVIHRGLANRPEVTEDTSNGNINRLSISGLINLSVSDKPLQTGNFLDAILRSVHFPIYIGFKHYLTQIKGSNIHNVTDIFYHTLSSTTTTSSSTTTTFSSTTTTS